MLSSCLIFISGVMKSSCMFLCGKAMEKVHRCTFLPSACQVVRGYSGRVFRETPCFCFSLQERERGGSRVQDGCPLARVTLWMMCMEHCLVQLSTLHSKRPFFNSRESRPLARTPLPSNPPSSPDPAAEPQLLPALLPLAAVQVLHVAQLGQVGGGPLSSEDTCFPVG